MSQSTPVLKIGMIGCDTSHCQEFSRLLNDPAAPGHYEGGTVVKAFPAGSPDFEVSYSRVKEISDDIAEKFKVRIVDTLEEAISGVDAILLESVDGRVHLEQFRACARAGKPTFIDKPFAVTSADAREIVSIAEKAKVPIFSSSSLRWGDDLSAVLPDDTLGAIYGIDVQGPCEFLPPIPDYFWYGVHCAEMVYQVLGAGCVEVTAKSTSDHDMIVGVWSDGRIGTIRGTRKPNWSFIGTLHREKGSQAIGDFYKQKSPLYFGLMREILAFFRTGVSPIPTAQMIEVVRFLEAASESRQKGGITVRL